MITKARVSKCVLTLAALLLLAAAFPLAAQEPAKPAAAPAGGQMQGAEMQEMMKMMAPGEHHKRLGNFVGHWTTHTKMWMAPGQPPSESSGTLDAEWTMGGRYVAEHHKGMFMGMPFEGQGIDGYDNVSGKYVTTWIDNMGTGILSTSGSCEDPDCKVVTTTGDAVDPMTKQKGTYKETTTWLGPGSFKFELYWTGADGNAMKIMEMTAAKK